MKYKIITLLSLTIIVFQLFNYKQVKNSSNEDLNNVKSSSWISLFKNNSLEGWHYFQDDGNKSGWTVDEGVFTFTSENASGEGDKSLLSDKDYSSFIIYFEWKVSPRSNSGFFWGVQEGGGIRSPYLTAPEIQIIDNERHPDARQKVKFHQAGAVYDLVEPSKDVCKPAGQWNHILLSIDHNKNKGSVKLNGTKILEFPLRGEKWESLVANSKFSDKCEYKRFAKLKAGKIGLQDHGNKVSFRNIKIRKL